MLVSDVRDYMNALYSYYQTLIRVDGIAPKLHFNLIKVNGPISRTFLEPLPASNAIAFDYETIHFVGVTIPLVEKLLHLAQELAQRGRITSVFGFKPHEDDRRRALATALFMAMLMFIACHELGHHFHGHQGKDSHDGKEPLRFYDESKIVSIDDYPSQAKEIEADGFATQMIMKGLLLGAARDMNLTLLYQEDHGESSDGYLVRLFMLATAGYFLSTATGSFSPDDIGPLDHPPKLSRMHFIMTSLREWARSASRPSVLRYARLRRYRRVVRAAKHSMRTNQRIGEESTFLNSKEGRAYLNRIAQEVDRVREEMVSWRWHLV